MATGAGYEDVVIASVVVTVLDRIDPGQPGLSIADARGTEASGQLRFELSLTRAATRAVSVAYATRDGTAMAGEDYEASMGTLTIDVGATSAHIVVPLLMDLFSEPDETFSVMLSQAQGARLVDADATGTIEADPADGDSASQRWLAQFGRIAGGQVMTAIGEQLTVSRDRAQVTVAGSRLNGGVRSGSRTSPVHWFGQDGLGSAPPDGWHAEPSHASPGHAFGSSASRSMDNPKLLFNSDFVLNAGPDSGRGVSLWGRGNYTRFNNLGEDLKAGGDAVSATLGIDRAWERYVLGIALSRSEVEADYGGAAQVPGELQSTVTGLYPYFGAQLTERFSIWGLVGRGRGELVAKPTADARAAQVDLKTHVTGFGAKGKLLAPGNGFSLAVKADTLLSRTRTGAADGILAAEGEHRRVRLGLEGAWLRELGEQSSLRTMLEVAAREDAGETQNGRGMEVVAGMEFIDVAPGLSFDLAVRGLLAHEVEDYEEWGVAGGFRYDPAPGTAVGPLVSPHAIVATCRQRTAAITVAQRPGTGADAIESIPGRDVEHGIRLWVRGLRRDQRPVGAPWQDPPGRRSTRRLQPGHRQRHALAGTHPLHPGSGVPYRLAVRAAVPRARGRGGAASPRRPRQRRGYRHRSQVPLRPEPTVHGSRELRHAATDVRHRRTSITGPF